MFQTFFCVAYVVAYYSGGPQFANFYLSAILATAVIIGLLQGDDRHAWHQRPRLSSDPKAPGHTIFTE
jgi:hypothetical protein